MNCNNSKVVSASFGRIPNASFMDLVTKSCSKALDDCCCLEECLECPT